MIRSINIQRIVFTILLLFLSGCGGGGSNSADTGNGQTNVIGNTNQDNQGSGNNEPNDSNVADDDDSADNGEQELPTLSGDDTFSSREKISHFVQHATFGATPTLLDDLEDKSASQWFINQLALPPSLILPSVQAAAPSDPEEDFSLFYIEQTSFTFWKNSIEAPDQLRQRVAFALSELLVVSNGGGEVLTDVPEAVAAYQDLLINNAFGNYRLLLEQVTYSPAMGHYLTYMGSEKGNDETGRMPDENYARELLQLFTLGVVALNKDGTERLNENGNPVELYTNKDITGLARVFTGLNLNEDDPEAHLGKRFSQPMSIFSDSHSEKEKAFLGFSIAAGSGAETSISQALDHIFNHENLAPFVTKQLIQRLVTSNPSTDYVLRVVSAFESGLFTLPDGREVGEKIRGDLTATIAAILFDQEARDPGTPNGGKIREPILRFTQWARAFEVQNVAPHFVPQLWDTSASADLGQHPYRSPSVFNFFRPGYKAPGSLTAAEGLVAPELQITNASSIPGYVNFMTYFITGQQQEADLEELKEEYEDLGIELNLEQALLSFKPNYEQLLSIAKDPNALLDQLNLLLCANQLSTNSYNNISQVIASIEEDAEDGFASRVHLAILMVMSSPDYLVQK
ncbi:hypothetical protein N473_24540 [Pseudoalteromonas luteoviolacea CPMOR-1]|uniref:DUF1800 domain-containing protein n=1 Tax=Pseudoalteromonas luteoviolacea CPMOR-1 TaxID=1365248 RepID=A0A167IW46_9GAMM|nr:DUF1800 family protein [Pseudoalteromonas luteoviolacea]KZN60150.1 hypothetical protein N473_24540 [Pseudoalteromonas luteoviolacea CPMOR-1]